MEKYDVQINFSVVDKSENEAIFNLQKFLSQAIIEFGLNSSILEHDVMEFIPHEQQNHSETNGKGGYLRR